ncbi:Na+/H+ antiporter subunit E [Streptomyces sp. RPT161]|uniref:Na+/H+ antiporter subunit E n=1 Tax=Streptomyces sp. RPT161 TaxID=3015993 RepID=UPI0022B86736|nr:Na+/H+ antiporter subunit E [Streptomyces sp. RPT161]
MRRADAVVHIAAWWAFLFVLNLMFISTVSTLELAVGAGAGVLAAVAAWAVRRASGTGGNRGGPWARALLAWPGAVLADTGRLAGATIAALRGREVKSGIREVKLRKGTGSAWASALLSATPGAYVVDVSPGVAGFGDTLTIHVLGDTTTALERVLTGGER